MLGLISEVKVVNGSGTVSDTKYSYDQYAAPQTPLYNCPNVSGHDNQNFAGGSGAGGTRGNVTQISNWLSTGSTWLNTYQSYSMCGNLMNIQDANGYTTSFSYNDNYSDGNNSRNTYGFVTGVTNALNQTPLRTQYDYSTGQSTVTADQRGQYTWYSYNASGYGLDRIEQVNHPNGGYTTYSYPSANEAIVQQDQSSAYDGLLQTRTITDGFGRVIETDTWDSYLVGSTWTNGWAMTQQTYDGLGRIASASNPYRSGDGEVWTSYSYDGLSRLTQVSTPDGAVANTSYSGNQTTVADQGGKARQYTYDGVGNLITVTEDPGDSSHLNYVTNYTYDALGNLNSVNKNGCPNCRTFSYDSLSRLVSALNPESGTVSYSYDNAGNVLTRTDNRGVVTTNTYDALNRVKTTSYSDQITSTANFGYDGAGGNATGQLTSFSNGNSATNFTSFDVMGNVLASTQQIGGQTYGFNYGYNLAGAVTSETYPSGRVVQTTYEQANRPFLVSGIASGNTQATNYAVAVHYAAHGALAGFARGNGVVSGYAYNNRLQLGNAWDTIEYSTSAYLYDETPNWGTSKDNGNLQAITVQAGGPAPLSSLPSLTTNYSYDAVNRLTGIWEPNYARGFSFDPAGNMWVTPNKYWGLTPTGPTSNIFVSKNQANTLTYDKSGRVISTGSTSFAYDAENRQTQATDAPGIGGGTVTYAFDAIGERVQKQISGGAATAYVYDAFGKLAAEYSTAANIAPCTTCYLTWDHLGTPRMVTDQNGNVVARHDYLPFGEEIQAGQAGRGSQYGPQADSVETKFTGQIRDAETGDDYFNARYYTTGAMAGL